MLNSLKPSLYGGGGGYTLFLSRDDVPKLEAIFGKDLRYGMRSDGRGAHLYGVEMWFSEFIPAGQAIVYDPRGRPVRVPITSLAEVLTTVTALGLAGVDERVG